MSERKIIARRAALELKPNSVVNLGIGMPEGVASVANEEKIIDLMTLTAEPGVDRRHSRRRAELRRGDQHAGDHRPALPVRLLRRRRPRRRVSRPGAGRPPRATSTVSKFGPRLAGAGGFINISQNAKKVVFVGTFTAGGLRGRRSTTASCRSCGKARRASSCSEVEHRTFSGAVRAGSAGSRCSTSPSAACSGSAEDGLELIEIAPGIDLERDILAQMDFRRSSAKPPRLMDDAHLRRRRRWGCASACCAIPLEQRFTYDADAKRVLHQFRAARASARSDDIEQHPPGDRGAARAARAQGLRHRQLRQFHDRCRSCSDAYADMVQGLVGALLLRRHALHDVAASCA